jgi:hypothetical protein
VLSVILWPLGWWRQSDSLVTTSEVHSSILSIILFVFGLWLMPACHLFGQFYDCCKEQNLLGSL